CMSICNMQIVSCMMNRSLCIIGMLNMSIRSINLKMEKKTFGRVETDGYLRDWRKCYRICQRIIGTTIIMYNVIRTWQRRLLHLNRKKAIGHAVCWIHSMHLDPRPVVRHSLLMVSFGG